MINNNINDDNGYLHNNKENDKNKNDYFQMQVNRNCVQIFISTKESDHFSEASSIKTSF